MAGILNLFKHKLVVVEFGVEAALFEELAVVALLDYLSIFEDDDFVRIEDGFEAVGNDEAGPSCDNSLHGFLNLSFRHGIHV